MAPSVLAVVAGGYLLLRYGVNAVVALSYRPDDPGAAGVWPSVLAGLVGLLGLWWLFFRHIGHDGIGLLRASTEVAAMLAATVAAVAVLAWGFA